MPDCPRPYIFISIPRCASSCVQSLLGLSGWKDLSKPADAGILDNHASAEMVRQRYGSDEFDRRFKFTFVRNPWDRCVSWYLYHSKEAPYNRFTFTDWIKAGMPHHWEIQNGTVYQSRRTPLEQFSFVTSSDGKLMVDFVGRTERLEQDMAHVAGRIGIELPQPIPRINAAETRQFSDYRRYYDDATAQQVGKILQQDVQRFEYFF